MSSQDWDFERALIAARAGSEWAWREIYADLAPLILRYLRGRGAIEPEDLLGDVFVQVVGKIDQFDGGADDFRAWVFTIARHRLIDTARSRARRPVDPVSDEVLVAAAGSADAEEQALSSLAVAEARKAIAQLSPDQQDVVLLRLVVGLSIKEVAAALGKNPGAIKALQVRAVAALRRNLPEGVSL
jgi:RNA polymerase sigma-70 factor (ECF subfamily)